MSLISLLVFVLVIGLVLYLVRMLPIDAEVKNVVLIIVIIIAILALLGAIGVIPVGNIRL